MVQSEVKSHMKASGLLNKNKTQGLIHQYVEAKMTQAITFEFLNSMA